MINLLAMGTVETVIFVAAIISAVSILLITCIIMFRCYKKCPPDKIMVIYGKVSKNPNDTSRSAICIHGGARMIWPFFQAYEFLDLTPISIAIDLRRALSVHNKRVDITSRFTVGISTEPEVMQNAAERLLGLTPENIKSIAKDIILSQLRLTIAHIEVEDTIESRDKFLEEIARNVEGEIEKIGLRLINLNIADIIES